MGRPNAMSWARRGRWLTVAILWGSLGGRWGPVVAQAEDPPRVARSADEPLLVQWFDVGALTGAAGEREREPGPFPLAVDTHNGEVPFFGGEGEGSFFRPFGSVTDLIELIQRATPDGGWERKGVSIHEQDLWRIVVQAPRSTVERIEAFLVGLERDALRTVTWDAVVLRGDPAAVPGPSDVAAAWAQTGSTPLVGVRATGLLGSVATARTGGERVRVADYDVEVFDDAKGAEQLVGILRDGLAIRVVPTTVDATRVRGRLEAWWATPARLSPHTGRNGLVIERSDIDGRSWNAHVDLELGAWTLLPSTGGVSLAVRPSVTAWKGAGRGHEPLIPLPADRPSGEIAFRRWSLRDLAGGHESRRGSDALGLAPHPAFTPEEPPELPEPAGAFPIHDLPDLIRAIVGSAALDRKGASVTIRNEELWASTDAATADAIDGVLSAVRARCLRAIPLKCTVLSMPLASLPEHVHGLGGDASLLADGASALVRRPGARILHRCALRLHAGQRGAVDDGEQHTYLAAFNFEIAEKSLLGNPILRSWLEGTSLDVRVHRTLRGDGAWCEVLLSRATARETRSVPTPFGAIECPSIGVQRVSGAFALPVGGSRIVAAHLEDGVVTLVILGVAAE